MRAIMMDYSEFRKLVKDARTAQKRFYAATKGSSARQTWQMISMDLERKIDDELSDQIKLF